MIHLKGLLCHEGCKGRRQYSYGIQCCKQRAVALFLNKKIKYLEIIDIIEACMENASFIENPSVDEILDTEQCAYDYISKRW
ncbi:MAG: hypothetical protein ACLRI8_01740 [Agathobacter rectalis]